MPQPVLPALVELLRRWDPEQIGGYTLIGRLGAGAMGQVYLGRSAAGRLVAVKTIRIELAEEPDFRNRFAQEVAAARRVSGAFTAAVVAADPEADMPWLATAYVPAPSLARLVRECGPLPVPAVRWLGAGCAEALESIHAAGLVHRDLKPSNVLVAPDGPRVIDFGVARAAERVQLTVTRGAIGTPAYMAPEQARDTRQATTASDVFSLGATMLFAATGHPPYQGETVVDVLVRLATGPPDLAGLPADLAPVVLGCLERDPRQRPTSAAVLAKLAPALDGAGGRDLGPSALPRPALALIDQYRDQNRPAPRSGEAGGPDDGGAEITLGSQPGSAAPGRPLAAAPPGRRRAPGRRRGRDAPPPDSTGTQPGLRPRRALLAAGAAAAAIVLLAAGAGIGVAFLAGHRQPRPAGDPHPGTSQSSQSPVILPPPPPAAQTATASPPPGHRAAPPGHSPAVTLSQDFGDSLTSFVLHGTGWPSGQPVIIRLAGPADWVGRQPADLADTFNCAINQGSQFPGGQLPPGRYRIVVTGAGGARAHLHFTVRNQPLPGVGPPPGQGPG
ncbi:MAG: serine/threonine-protein kinase [Streptosporangiaceae bacterium]